MTETWPSDGGGKSALDKIGDGAGLGVFRPRPERTEGNLRPDGDEEGEDDDLEARATTASRVSVWASSMQERMVKAACEGR